MWRPGSQKSGNKFGNYGNKFGSLRERQNAI
ncbi:Uncharacterised protein [Mycobacteroides abscessus subsp. abscessus]|nr:Uncharacterised protein [Mycobacteroides abscessus subsp. abscessus]